MKIKPTNKFICIQNVPYFEKDKLYDIISLSYKGINPHGYSNVFTQIYEFDDGSEVYLDKIVYRIIKNQYSQYSIKRVHFNPIHFDKEDIFPTESLAKTRITELENEYKERVENSNTEEKLNRINLLANVKVEEKTIKELATILENIRKITK